MRPELPAGERAHERRVIRKRRSGAFVYAPLVDRVVPRGTVGRSCPYARAGR